MTALCGPAAGTAKVRAIGDRQREQRRDQSHDRVPAATREHCPSSPPAARASARRRAGPTLTLNGGRFFGSPATTRVQFTANGITRDGIVQDVSANQVTILTPGFPELAAPTVPAAISLTLGTNLRNPSCCRCRAASPTERRLEQHSDDRLAPAVLGHERRQHARHDRGLRILDQGGVQVFFGNVEANVVSVSFNQIVVLSPPAFGAGAENLNATVQRHGPEHRARGSSRTESRTTTPAAAAHRDARTTCRGRIRRSRRSRSTARASRRPSRFRWRASRRSSSSVSATELPSSAGLPAPEWLREHLRRRFASRTSTPATAATGLSFTYIAPPNGDHRGRSGFGASGDSVTVTGVNFPDTVADAEVKFGSRTAFVTSVSPGSITVIGTRRDPSTHAAGLRPAEHRRRPSERRDGRRHGDRSVHGCTATALGGLPVTTAVRAARRRYPDA